MSTTRYDLSQFSREYFTRRPRHVNIVRESNGIGQIHPIDRIDKPHTLALKLAPHMRNIPAPFGSVVKLSLMLL